MKKKIALLTIIICATLAFVPALAGCSETYVEYTLYDAGGNAVSTYQLADDPSAADNETIEAEDGSYFVLTGYSGKPREIVIPATYGGIPVTQIGEYAFEGAAITSVTMTDSITEIGKGAFFYCAQLATVELSSSITEIKTSTFGWNYALTNIDIPDGVTSIGSYAFYGDSLLESIVIPDKVTYIGIQAFCECEVLSEVTLSASLEKIDQAAFQSCVALTEIVLPDSLVSIEYGAFMDCETLVSVTVGSGLETIGEYAFYYCLALEDITLGSSVKNIETYAFYYCTALKTVTLSDSIEYIGAYAFSSCSALENVYINGSKIGYLYTGNLAELEETDEKESGYYTAYTAGGDNAAKYLYTSYNYFGDGILAHAGYVPASASSDSESMAKLLRDTLTDVYWYFV